jgi:hypothetical protein
MVPPVLQQLPPLLQRVWLKLGSPHEVHWLFVHRMLPPGQSVSCWQEQCV